MMFRLFAALGCLLLAVPALAQTPYGASHTTTPPAGDRSLLVPNTGWVGGELGTALPVAGATALYCGSGSVGRASACGTTVTLPAAAAGTVALKAAGTNVNVAIVPSGSGAFSLAVPDGTTVGGNARGVQALDLQLSAGFPATTVASGYQSIAVGMGNTAALSQSMAFGNGNNVSAASASAYGVNNVLSGFGSTAIGVDGVDSGRTAALLFGGGLQFGNGQQSMREYIGALTTSTLAARLTADQNAPHSAAFLAGNGGNGNVINILPQSTFLVAIALVGRDEHVAGQAARATAPPVSAVTGISGVLSCGATVATCAYTPISAGTLTTSGVGLAAVPSVSADTSIGGLNISILPPNTDTWTWFGVVDTVEVQ